MVMEFSLPALCLPGTDRPFLSGFRQKHPEPYQFGMFCIWFLAIGFMGCLFLMVIISKKVFLVRCATAISAN